MQSLTIIWLTKLARIVLSWGRQALVADPAAKLWGRSQGKPLPLGAPTKRGSPKYGMPGVGAQKGVQEKVRVGVVNMANGPAKKIYEK